MKFKSAQDKSSFKQAGFTLVELLVVVSIISMLSSIVLGSIGEARKKAQIIKVKEEFANVGKALELYRLDHGDYPSTDLVPTITIDELFTGYLSPYMSSPPSDIPSWLKLSTSPVIRYANNPKYNDSTIRTCGSGSGGEKYFVIFCSNSAYADSNFLKVVNVSNGGSWDCGAGVYYCTHQPAN